MATVEETTELVQRLARGDSQAGDLLMPLVYDELRRIAARFLRKERPEHTLQATALVHEAWIRLVDLSRMDYRDRSHFLAMAARLMRRVLVDAARTRNAAKRGGGEIEVVSLHDVVLQDGAEERQYDLLALDEALQKLAALNERQARLIELRFFGGLTIEESAEVLGVSDRTLKSDWRMARVWLLREMRAGAQDEQAEA